MRIGAPRIKSYCYWEVEASNGDTYYFRLPRTTTYHNLSNSQSITLYGFDESYIIEPKIDHVRFISSMDKQYWDEKSIYIWKLEARSS